MAQDTDTEPPVIVHGRIVSADDTEAPRLSTFYSLRYPQYRLLWLGQIGAAGSLWMEQVARPLLMLELTNSALMVGLAMAMRLIPQLLIGVWAGVIADRSDKRQILLTTQAATLVTHIITGTLIVTGLIEPWMVLATTFATGATQVFNQPARSSLIPRLVPREALTNALALNTAAMNLMRIGGASLAGLVLIFFDLGELYFIQAFMYVWVMLWTVQITVRTKEGRGKQRASMMTDLREGFAVVGRDKAIFYMLLISLVLFVFGFPYQSVFVPLIAVQSLGMERSGVGLLVSVTGIGALAGSLTIATFGTRIRRQGLVMLVMICIYSLALIGFAWSGSVALAIPGLIIVGGLQTAFISINNAFVLNRTEPALHGRIMSLFSLDRGLIPLGALLGGALADTWGPPTGLTTMALICLALTIGLAVFVPSLRKLEQ